MDLILTLIASYFIINKRKLEWVLVIIMALATNLFQVSKVFANTFVFPNITDAALILIFLMFVVFYNKKHGYQSLKPICKITMVFFVYIAFVIIIDLIINGISFVSVIKTSRHWLCLLILFIIPKFPYNALYKALRITFYITIIASSIIILEYIIGTEYFTKTMVENGVKRGALPSYYAFFYTLLVFTNYYSFSKTKKYVFLAILIVSQLVSVTRSISLAIAIGIALCMWYLSKEKIVSLLKLGGFCIIIYFSSFALPSLNKRFNEAFEEISRIEQSYKQLDSDGNMTFRLYMLVERYQYLKTNPQYYLFGIGNVIEQDFPTKFFIGGFNEEMQRPTQLDTGDITWPLIILRLGMIGLVLYMILIFSFIRFKCKLFDFKLYIITKAYLLSTLMVISFAGSHLARGEFWIMPVICIVMISQTSFYKKEKQLIKNQEQ